jgi:hypothetical protein
MKISPPQKRIFFLNEDILNMLEGPSDMRYCVDFLVKHFLQHNVFHAGYSIRRKNSYFIKAIHSAQSHIGLVMSKYYRSGEIEVHPQEGAALTFAFCHGKSRTNGKLSALNFESERVFFWRGGGDAREIKGEGLFKGSSCIVSHTSAFFEIRIVCCCTGPF